MVTGDVFCTAHLKKNACRIGALPGGNIKLALDCTKCKTKNRYNVSFGEVNATILMYSGTMLGGGKLKMTKFQFF